MKDLLLITSPFTQLNTPYPATAYLKGFLNTKNISSFQIELGIETILNLFNKNNLTTIFNRPIELSELSNVRNGYQTRKTFRFWFIQSLNETDFCL